MVSHYHYHSLTALLCFGLWPVMMHGVIEDGAGGPCSGKAAAAVVLLGGKKPSFPGTWHCLVSVLL